MASSSNPRTKAKLKVSGSLQDLVADLAGYIADISEMSIKKRGRFTLALSGGCLISAVCRKLCGPPYYKLLDWNKWDVYLTDELRVACNQPYINSKRVNDGLLSRVGLQLKCIINDKVPMAEAALQYEDTIRQHMQSHLLDTAESNGCPKFDLILLEMGLFGTVASLYPNHKALQEKLKLVTYISDAPEHFRERITFTFPVINAASNVAIIAAGRTKASAVKFGVDGYSGGSLPPLLPACMVEPTEGKLVWFLDRPAASNLDSRYLMEEEPVRNPRFNWIEGMCWMFLDLLLDVSILISASGAGDPEQVAQESHTDLLVHYLFDIKSSCS